MTPPTEMTAERVGELRARRETARAGGFAMLALHPDDFDALLLLASEALAAREEKARVDGLLYGKGDRNRGVSLPAPMTTCLLCKKREAPQPFSCCEKCQKRIKPAAKVTP